MYILKERKEFSDETKEKTTMSDKEKEQKPEPEQGKEEKPEVFIPIPLDRVSLNSQEEEKARKS
jgi:hypothetical protein